MANIAMTAPAIIPETAPRVTVAFTGWAVVDVDMKVPFRCGSPTVDEPHRNPPTTPTLPSRIIRKSDGRIRPPTGSLPARRRLGRDGRRVTDQRNEPCAAQPAGSFDAFVGPHLAVLLRVAGSLCRNPHDAEDLVQDTLVRAFNGLATFDGAYPRAWLLTIMRNANINRHRRQRPGLLRDATDLSGEVDRRNPPAPSAEDVATARTQAPWITDALGRLSARHLQVVQLVDIDGLTYDEAAAG